MVRRTSLRALSSAVLFALLLTALHPQPAWADEGTPPPTDPAATETAASGEPAEEGVTDPATSGEPVPAPEASEAAPPTDASNAPMVDAATTDASASEPASSPADLLALVPDGTSVAVVDAQGVPVPLVSQQSADIVATGDPIWCPASVSTPVDGGAGCTSSYTSFADLLTYLDSHEPTVDGIIWFAKEYDSGTDDPGVNFTLDGLTNFTTMALRKLTLRGGWNGLTTNTIDTLDPSELNGYLAITGWKNDVTLTDLLISEVSGTPHAVTISTTKKVTLNRVRVENNISSGADLNNAGGDGDVLITSSRFINNTGLPGTGLGVTSKGKITVSDVLATGNLGPGVSLDNSAGKAKSVVLTSGLLEFRQNTGSGLQIWSNGSISLKDITSTGNGGDGVFLNNTTGGNAAVSLTGTNIFCENGSRGLSAFSSGTIAASNLVVDLNGNHGAFLDNSTGASAATVTLTGWNEFRYNGGGLAVWSRGGITVNNLTATNSHASDGVFLENTLGPYGVRLIGPVTVTDNYNNGLYVTSGGAITLGNVTATGNGIGGSSGAGAHLQNIDGTSSKPITISGTNVFNDNYSGGLVALSQDDILLGKVTASGNWDTGALLDNTFDSDGEAHEVTVGAAGVFNGNGSHGLKIVTRAAITLADLTASYNWDDGARLDILSDVSLSGTNVFDGNGENGLWVHSEGNIAVANLQAHWNGAPGAHLDNGGSRGGSITLSGTSEFAYNGDTGLEAIAPGNITVADVDSYNNGGSGMLLTNVPADGAGNVSVGTSRPGWCNALSGNTYSGLEVYSYGTVTLRNLCTQGNGDPAMGSPYGWGVRVDNSGALSAKPVNLTGWSSFRENYSGGLFIRSVGVVSGNDLLADDNLNGPGVIISNTSGDPRSPKNVTLSGKNELNGNAMDGLELHTYGTVRLDNISASGNGGNGMLVDNFTGAVTPRTVTLRGYAKTSDNSGDGLLVYSLGAITVASLEAGGNAGNGAYLTNDFVGAPGGITMSGAGNNFWENGGYGLQMLSRHVIAVDGPDGLDAWDNGSWGASLDNRSGLASLTLKSAAGGRNEFWGNGAGGLIVQSRSAITLSQLASSGNTGDGLVVLSPSVITLAGLEASGNTGTGAVIDNTLSGPASPQAVKLNLSATFYENDEDGLVVRSYGPITLANLTASGNGAGGISGDGVALDNYLSGSATIAKSITLAGPSSFEDNFGNGLSVVSIGTISANSLTARGNGADGVYLDNQRPGAVGGITLSGVNTFDENGSIGLDLASHGAITLSDLSASENGYDGASLDTRGLLVPQNITLTGKNAFLANGDIGANTGDGLRVYADGKITISNITASGNAEDGAYLDNDLYSGSGSPAITLSGLNVFLGNGLDGLGFQSAGSVSLSRITSDENGQNGITGVSDGSITLSCVSLLNNGNAGWWLGSPALVTLKGVFAFGNAVLDHFDGPGTLLILRGCP